MQLFFKNLLRRLHRYLNPKVDPDVLKEMDRQCLRNIHYVSLAAFGMEVLTLILFMCTGFTPTRATMVSLFSVCSGTILCSAAAIISLKCLKNRDVSHGATVAFRTVFYIVFMVWAIFGDYRHYKAGEQMLIFHCVNLTMACFVLFRPWLGMLLTCGAYLGLYVVCSGIDGAANIQPLNYLVLMGLSAVAASVRFHNQIWMSSRSRRLTENYEEMKSFSLHDGLTGLLNRLALEQDAGMADGRQITAYMIDINYFKEINDAHGHSAGDAILRETSNILKHIYPGARCYRYGGDEFLVLSRKAPERNYGGNTYDYTLNGINVVLSIGSAQGSPESYDELFQLISAADKALYTVKRITHSQENGGHERRKPQ